MAYSDGSGALAPPSDIATEKYVLGGVLHVSARRGNNEFYYEVSEQITPDDFFSPPCLTIWSAMKAVADKGIVVTRQTVTENIKSSGVWVHDQPLIEVMDILIDDASFIAFEIVDYARSEEHTSELQSRLHLVCRLLLEKKKTAEKMKA